MFDVWERQRREREFIKDMEAAEEYGEKMFKTKKAEDSRSVIDFIGNWWVNNQLKILC